MALPQYPHWLDLDSFSHPRIEGSGDLAASSDERSASTRRFAWVIFLSIGLHGLLLSLKLGDSSEPVRYGDRNGTIFLEIAPPASPSPTPINPLDTLLDELLNFEITESTPITPAWVPPTPLPEVAMPMPRIESLPALERWAPSLAELETILPNPSLAPLPRVPDSVFEEPHAQAKPASRPPRSQGKAPPRVEPLGNRVPMPKIESTVPPEVVLPKITDADPRKEIATLVGPGVVPPRTGLRTSASLLANPNPPYPPAALAQKLEGRVVVELAIDEKGTVTEAKVYASSGHAVLDEAALQYARTLRCMPERSNNVPVPSRHFLPLRYAIAP